MPKFKTRARAIDMLGRQQIAGTQNAINEIFKNAHDAYARHARIDFFEDEGTLVIRDDGVGMKMTERSSGNGLRIMQYRADLMGGTLDIASVEGEGVTVTCVVPRREVRSQEPRVAAARTDSTSGEK